MKVDKEYEMLRDELMEKIIEQRIYYLSAITILSLVSVIKFNSENIGLVIAVLFFCVFFK